MSQLFTSGGQSIGVPASTPALPMNTQRAGVDVGSKMSETQEGISQPGLLPSLHLFQQVVCAWGKAPPDAHLDPRCKGYS